ncbi:MAG TPA: GAF domain-containing protein, partial [Aggregatilineales bacterium]|nr:GAF domain-containing protein [Aggregatilineales bacterium]
MSNQPTPGNSLLDKLGALQTNWNEIETFLRQLVPALSKVGFKLSVDPLALLQKTTRSMVETTQQAKLIADQLKQLQDLINESAVITSSLELDQVLERVIDTVITLTGAGRAYLMLRDAKTGELSVRTARNWDKEQLKDDAIAYSRSVVDAAIKQQSPVLTTNAQIDERFARAASVADMSLLMILCIPLMIQGQVVGVLYADSRVERGLFREDQVPLLSAFAT